MRRKEFEALLRRSRARSRFSSYVTLEDQLLSEKETAEILVDLQQRTIQLERRARCSYGHVISEGNPVVGRCGVPDCDRTLLCQACRAQGCSARGCSCLTLCNEHKHTVAGEHRCPRHVLSRYVKLILGF